MNNMDDEEAQPHCGRQVLVVEPQVLRDQEFSLEAGMDRMLMIFRSSQIPSTWKFMQLGLRMALLCVDHVLIVDWRQATGVMQEM